MAAQKLGTLAPTTVSAPSSPLRDAGFSKPQAEPTVTMVQSAFTDRLATRPGTADLRVRIADLGAAVAHFKTTVIAAIVGATGLDLAAMAIATGYIASLS